MLKIVIVICLSGTFLQTVFSVKDGVECNLWDTKYLPHANCSKFYVCDNGLLLELECPPTLYFNPKLEVCDYPINVPECVGGTREPEYTLPSSPTPPITTTKTPGTTSTESTSSTSASTAPPTTSTSTAPTTISSSTTTEPPTPSTSTVPSKTSTSTEPSTTTIALSSLSPEPPSTTPPSYVPECPSEGVSLHPLPGNCTFYVLCAEGFPLIQKCTDGTCFDAEQSKCEIPADSDPQQSSAMDIESICLDNEGEVKLYPSRGSCIEYHICFGKTYKGQQECRRDKHFHYFTQNCIPKEQSDCNAND